MNLDALPTRTKLERLRLLQNVECVFCTWKPETIEHVLRDCDMAAAVWLASVGLGVHDAQRLSMCDWLIKCAESSSNTTLELMFMTIWSLWKS